MDSSRKANDSNDPSTTRTFFPFIPPLQPSSRPSAPTFYPGTNAHLAPTLKCDLSIHTFTTSDQVLAPSSERAGYPASVSLSAGLHRQASDSSASGPDITGLLRLGRPDSTVITPLQPTAMAEDSMEVVPNSEGEEEEIMDIGEPVGDYSLPSYISLQRPPGVSAPRRPTVLVPGTATEVSSIQDFSEVPRPSDVAQSSNLVPAAAVNGTRGEDIGTFPSGSSSSKAPSALPGGRTTESSSLASKVAPAPNQQRRRPTRISSQRARDAQEEIRLEKEKKSSVGQEGASAGGSTSGDVSLEPTMLEVRSSSVAANKSSATSKKRGRGKDSFIPDGDAEIAAALSSSSKRVRTKPSVAPGPSEEAESSAPVAKVSAKKGKARQVVPDSEDEAGPNDGGDGTDYDEYPATTSKAKKGKAKAKKPSKPRASKASTNFKSAETVDSDVEDSIVVPAKKPSTVPAPAPKADLPPPIEPEADSGDDSEPVKSKSKSKPPPKKKARRSVSSPAVPGPSQHVIPDTPVVPGQVFDLTSRGSRSKSKSKVAASPAGSVSSPVVGAEVQDTPSSKGRGRKRKAVVDEDEDDEEEIVVPASVGGKKKTAAAAARKIVSTIKVVVPKAPAASKGKKAKVVAQEAPTEADDEEEKETEEAAAVPSKAGGKENENPTPQSSPAPPKRAISPRKPKASTSDSKADVKPKRGLASVLAKFGHTGIRRLGLTREKKHHLHSKINPNPKVQKRVPQKFSKKRGEYDSGEEEVKKEKGSDDESSADEKEPEVKQSQQEQEVDFFDE